MSTDYLSLHDFSIIGSIEVDVCGNGDGFRAVRKSDELPVLLHRFRPGSSLLDTDPRLSSSELPDFSRPFVSRFTGIVKAAGSAFLVEPLPWSAPVEDVWRKILCTDPEKAVDFLRILLARVHEAVTSFCPSEARLHGLCLDNLVLTENSVYGILASVLETGSGLMVLRPQNGQGRPGNGPRALRRVVDGLLMIEKVMSRTLRKDLLSDGCRHRIRCMPVQ